jgi:hypothetical protein
MIHTRPAGDGPTEFTAGCGGDAEWSGSRWPARRRSRIDCGQGWDPHGGDHKAGNNADDEGDGYQRAGHGRRSTQCAPEPPRKARRSGASTAINKPIGGGEARSRWGETQIGSSLSPTPTLLIGSVDRRLMGERSPDVASGDRSTPARNSGEGDPAPNRIIGPGRHRPFETRGIAVAVNAEMARSSYCRQRS